MLRNILGIIVGYIVMAVIVVSGLFIVYAVLGEDFAFKADTFKPSIMWILVMFVMGIIASVVGGMVCRMIGRSQGATLGIAAAILVLGAVNAVVLMQREAPTEPRVPGMSASEAMGEARTPLWVLILNPLVGVAGVVLGGAMVSKEGAPVMASEPEAPAED